jgi:hypothetical protein
MSGWEAVYVRSVGYVWARGWTCPVISDLEVSRPQAGYVQQRNQTCPVLLVRKRFGNSRKFNYQKICHIGQ